MTMSADIIEIIVILSQISTAKDPVEIRLNVTGLFPPLSGVAMTLETGAYLQTATNVTPVKNSTNG